MLLLRPRKNSFYFALTSLFCYWVLIVLLLLSKTPILSQTTSLPSSSPLFYYLHILWYPTLCNHPSLLAIYNCLMGLSNNFIRIFGPSLFGPRKRFLFSFSLFSLDYKTLTLFSVPLLFVLKDLCGNGEINSFSNHYFLYKSMKTGNWVMWQFCY